MRHWPLWLALGILTGCASSQPIELPEWPQERATVEAVEPLELPELPQLGQAGDVATIDRAGVQALFAYVEAAEANTEIAEANAAALLEMIQAYNAAADAGRFMNQLAGIRDDQLRQARSQALQDRIFYRTLIGLSAVAAILAGGN